MKHEPKLCPNCEAIIKTLNKIMSLNDCGAISDMEFIHLGKELWADL